MRKSWFLAPLLTACTGVIGASSGGVAVIGNGSGGSTNPAAGGTNGAGSGPGTGTTPVLSYAMTRLTNSQYLNSIKDLFGSFSFDPPSLAMENVTGGFVNVASGQTVTALGIEDYANAAEALAGVAKANSAKFFGCNPTNAADETSCLSKFLADFGKRAFRRPLSDDETKRFLAFFQSQRSMASDFATAASTVVQVLLQAPAFLYRIETGGAQAGADGSMRLAPYELASRLSYFLTDGPPDADLMKAADQGLSQVDDVETQARRLLGTDRAKAMVSSFNTQWLQLRKITSSNKDATAFPKFTADVANALAASTARFVDYAFWQADSLRALLTDTHGFVNDALAPYFGVPAPGAKELQMMSLDPSQRAGVLTQPGLLTGLSGPVSDSPVQRGVLVLDSFLCRHLPPPPKGVNTNPPPFDPKQPATTRQRMEKQHAASGDCAACHAAIDGIGFAFENFDAVGTWRTTDSGLPVDASAELLGTDVDGKMDGAIAMANRLADSRQVADCVAYTWMRYALGLDETQLNMAATANVSDRFWTSGGKFSDLLVAIATSDAFLNVKAAN